jgi:hypothetical protein
MDATNYSIHVQRLDQKLMQITTILRLIGAKVPESPDENMSASEAEDKKKRERSAGRLDRFSQGLETGEAMPIRKGGEGRMPESAGRLSGIPAIPDDTTVTGEAENRKGGGRSERAERLSKKLNAVAALCVRDREVAACAVKDWASRILEGSRCPKRPKAFRTNIATILISKNPQER